jgi:hypothetical protein
MLIIAFCLAYGDALPPTREKPTYELINNDLEALVGLLSCRAFADRIFGLMQQPTHGRHPEHVSFRRTNDSPLRPQYRSGLAGQLQAGASSEGRLTCVLSRPTGVFRRQSVAGKSSLHLWEQERLPEFQHS